jgi:hypothetical protein
LRLVLLNIFIVLCTLYSCNSSDKNEPINSSENNKQEDITSLSPSFKEIISTPVHTIDTLNQIDKTGLKQGRWEIYQYDKIWKREHYHNDKLHGYQMTYSSDSNFALFISYYENGKHLWSAFPWELCDYIVPVKGFLTEENQVEIHVPYNSGKRMYEGTIAKQKSSSVSAIGIHKAYYETGELKATIDYTSDSITIYTLKGNQIFSDKISKWKGRNLSSFITKQ